jgi:hypothetical protein
MRLYYIPPAEECFNELKEKAIEIWESYRKGAETHSYVDSKVKQLNKLQNYSDNFMYIYAMFDSVNQSILLDKVSDRTRQEIIKRLKN